MSFEIRVRLKAREDITDAALWYEAQNAGLGSHFVDEVERTFGKIAHNPTTYRILYRETRRAILQRFPFGVFYRIYDQAVVVIAVMHSSRDPQRWRQRT
jgi:plasmid stabilization system protein ParE